MLKPQANGKYVQGVQGIRISRDIAKNAVKVPTTMGSSLKLGGNVLGLVAISLSVSAAYQTEGLEEKFEHGFDAFMGAAGFIPYGAPVSIFWSLGGKKLHKMWVNEVIIPQYHMGIVGLPSTMPFK